MIAQILSRVNNAVTSGRSTGEAEGAQSVAGHLIQLGRSSPVCYQVVMPTIAGESYEQRLADVLRRTMTKVGPEARDQLAALITPDSLAIVAAVLVAWVVSHAFGVGEIVDVITSVVGIFSIGMAVFSGIDEFYQFGSRAYYARTPADLDAAAQHLAKAIAILGIQAVLAWLFRGRPRGGRVFQEDMPPIKSGVRYRPQTTRVGYLKAHTGRSNFWGDSEISSLGTKEDQELARVHESIHQFLAPKFYILRRYRVENTAGSYINSSFYRYTVEAVAETLTKLRVRGYAWENLKLGMKYPVYDGEVYVYLMKAGAADSELYGSGLIPEGAGLIAGGLSAGYSYHLWFKRGAPGLFREWVKSYHLRVLTGNHRHH